MERFDLPYSREGRVADTSSAFTWMSRIPHQPEVLDWCPSGKAEGAEGGYPLTNAADNALGATCIVGKSAGGCGFLVDDCFWF